MNERHKALLAIIACVLFWGLSFISIKVTVVVFPPMTLGALRFALATGFLLRMKRRSAPKEKLKLRDLPGLLAAGLIGVSLYFFCENNGVALVSASEASIIVSTIPVLTMAAEWLGERLFRNLRRNSSMAVSASGASTGSPGSAGSAASAPPARITGRRWLGALISMAGVILVAKVSLSLSGNVLGYIYMAGAALSWVAYCFLTRPLFARCSRIHIVFWQSVFGFAGFLPFAALEFPRWGRPDLFQLLHLAFLGICCSALGYWYYARSLEALGVSVSSIFINFIPVVTVIAGFFVLGERLSPAQWAGAALVLGGVYLAMVERAPG